MIDMRATIAPKSDQLNADDLIGGPRTITVRGVKADPSSKEQPVSIFFEGDDNKPYKPCKSMRRLMVHIWGPDAAQYTGRSMTLYMDKEVTFGGMKVGGIRISHMSDMDAPQTVALTATRASRKPYTVKPLQQAQKPKKEAAKDYNALALAAAQKGLDFFREWYNSAEGKECRANVELDLPALKEVAEKAGVEE